MIGFLRDTRGTAALEFGLIAPIFALATLAVADLGFAMSNAFGVDQAMRNGAEAAIDDPGETVVSAALASAAGASTPAIAWSVDRFCACREAPATAVDCSTTCNGSAPTSIFYSLVGTRQQQNVILPNMSLRRTAMVQVR